MRRLLPMLSAVLILGCGQPDDPEPTMTEPAAKPTAETVPPVAQQAVAGSDIRVDRFADIEVLRYRVPGFDELSLKQKQFVYFLAQAALAGHDIIFDQNFAHNLRVRRTLAAIVETYTGDREADNYTALLDYAKRVWFANGIHHHYSNRKMAPEFPAETFASLVRASDASRLPLLDGESVDDLVMLLTPILFDPDVAAVKVNKDTSVDQLTTSATNFYRDVTQAEAEAFYAAKNDPDRPQQVSWGLNSQLARVDGEIVERVWWIDGMYGQAIEQIVYWLGKALEVAENDAQVAWLERLIAYYETGALEHFDAYNVAWVQDTDSRIDTINGFIEVYGDPLGYRGAWESVVSIRDLDATDRIAAIGSAAQWFEDNSPIMDAHKKDDVVGISAKVITVVMEGGDAAPSTPIGINLPNANWIRRDHGSKSVTLGNIIDAYNDASAASGLHDEFMLTEEEKARFEAHGNLAYNLDVDLHEVIGHASGQINPGVGTPKETLKSYSSTLEETRADLVALYYMLDPKLIELGVMDTLEVGKTTYDRFIRNGLLIQLQRIEPGDDIESAHMRNRQLIASWVFEKGLADNVIEKVVQDGKTYFVIRDYDQLRMLFGELLTEVQRIKSEGDYEAGKQLVETYGVKVDQALHQEVLERVEPLDIAPYAGFVQPRLMAVEQDGEIVDVQIHYDEDFVTQMLRYEREHSHLPVVN